MKKSVQKSVLAASIVANALLVNGLWLTQRSHEVELDGLLEKSIRGDERHLSLHSMSLSAIESGDSEQAKEVAYLLRRLVEAGEHNARVRAELLD